MNHHICIYNGKTVTVDYVADRKREFRVAAQRVQDNLPTGGVGYVICPDGRKFEIREGSRTARLMPPECEVA